MLTVAVCGALAALGAAPAFAGEVTGSGKKIDQNQGKSWCSFSGLNDKIPGEGDTSTQAQSYGQDVRLGEADPHVANPGIPAVRLRLGRRVALAPDLDVEAREQIG